MSNELRLSSEKRLRLFTGRGYPELADEVASELGIPITPTSAYDFANGEIANGEVFHVRAKQGNQPALNLIAKLDMRKGPDRLVIVTMMRKDDFRTDAFGGGKQKTYDVDLKGQEEKYTR